MKVNSGQSLAVYDSLVMNGLHQQLQLHMLMTLETSQRQRADSSRVPVCLCVFGHVSGCKSAENMKYISDTSA